MYHTIAGCAKISKPFLPCYCIAKGVSRIQTPPQQRPLAHVESLTRRRSPSRRVAAPLNNAPHSPSPSLPVCIFPFTGCGLMIDCHSHVCLPGADWLRVFLRAGARVVCVRCRAPLHRRGRAPPRLWPGGLGGHKHASHLSNLSRLGESGSGLGSASTTARGAGTEHLQAELLRQVTTASLPILSLCRYRSQMGARRRSWDELIHFEQRIRDNKRCLGQVGLETRVGE